MDTSVGIKLNMVRKPNGTYVEEFHQTHKHQRYLRYYDKKRNLTHIEFFFKDGSGINYKFNRRITCIYPDKKSYYSLLHNGTLSLSKALDIKLFSKKNNKKERLTYINDIKNDFPNTAFITLINECYKKHVPLHNKQRVWETIINYFRKKVEVKKIEHNISLSKAANKHARYLVINFHKKLGKHILNVPEYESEVDEGYFETSPYMRAMQCGFEGDLVSEFYFTPTNPINDALTFIGQFFHRKGFLQNSYHQFGYAEASKKNKRIAVINLGLDKTIKDKNLVVFPTDWQQTNLTIADERPFPLKKVNLNAGYPITVMSFNKRKFKIKKVALYDNKGKQIDGYQKFYINNDITTKYPGFIPSRMLKPNTKYKIKVFYWKKGKGKKCKTQTASYHFKTCKGIKNYDLFFRRLPEPLIKRKRSKRLKSNKLVNKNDDDEEDDDDEDEDDDDDEDEDDDDD